jgi:putative oxygen-independent coproporphyrinogen III oxidase
MAFSLYIHIPYCRAKCPYCDFNSYAVEAWPEEDYIRAVLCEMGRRASEAPFAGQPVKTIYFGGGTPSLFRPASIGAIIDAAQKTFALERGAEITLEANPGTVDLAKLGEFRASGVNRLSMGVQSFDNATLGFLGRIHDAAQARTAVATARRAGFERLSLDLIFAVPGQTVAGLTGDIAEAAALEPDHVSAYNLTFEPGTRFFTDMHRGKIRELKSREQALMYATVREELPRRGYPMYEISNFARPGHEARHNLTYWRAETYLGLGAGAHSFARDGAGGRRWWNERDPGRYLALALGSGCAEAGSETIDVRTAMGEFVFLNLRLRDGFRLGDFQLRFGKSFDDAFGARSCELVEGGVLERADGRIRLTERGLEVADSVFAEFV